MDYKPGASGHITMGETVRARADGYTLALGNMGALLVLPNLFPDLPFDSQKSFLPVTALGQAPLVMVVRKNAPAKSWKELVEESKTKPMTLGSLGMGSPYHLAFELLKSKDNSRMVRVPYKGTAEQSLAAAEFQKATEADNVREYVVTQGLMPFPASHQEISTAMKQETER